MANVKNPLFSFSASGLFSNFIVFNNSTKRKYVSFLNPIERPNIPKMDIYRRLYGIMIEDIRGCANSIKTYYTNQHKTKSGFWTNELFKDQWRQAVDTRYGDFNWGSGRYGNA